MEFSKLLSRFVNKSPLSVMAQMTLESLFGAARLNSVFEEVASHQFTKELLFSTCTDLLVEVTLFGNTSVHAAYVRNREEIPVSIVSVYKKLQGVEPAVCEALVSQTADAATLLVGTLQARRPEPIPGYRLRIADGNVLKRSERRLKVLRNSEVAALPGKTVVLYDYATRLISRLVACENGNTNERLLMPDLLPHLRRGDLFMADSSYATMDFLQALEERQVAFVVRHHSQMKLEPVTQRQRAGKCPTGKVWEQTVRLTSGQTFRAIIIERDKPLRTGRMEVILLTNMPPTKATAQKLAELYLKRWTIEEAFRQLTQYLSCEVKTLGYPKAALLAFSLAVLAYNCLACVQAALASVHGQDKVEQELSAFFMALEVKRTSDGLRIAVPAKEWLPYATMSPEALADTLKQIATHVDWRRYRKSPRGPKKSIPKTRKEHMHLATAQLLEQRKKTKATVR